VAVSKEHKRAIRRPVKGHWNLPGDGHGNCPVMAMGAALVLAITGRVLSSRD